MPWESGVGATPCWQHPEQGRNASAAARVCTCFTMLREDLFGTGCDLSDAFFGELLPKDWLTGAHECRRPFFTLGCPFPGKSPRCKKPAHIRAISSCSLGLEFFLLSRPGLLSYSYDQILLLKSLKTLSKCPSSQKLIAHDRHPIAHFRLRVPKVKSLT